MLIFMLLFVLELLKYWLGLSVIDGVSIINKPIAFLTGSIYLVLLFLIEIDAVERHLLMYLVIFVTLCFTVKHNRKQKFFILLGAVFVLALMDEIFGILFESINESCQYLLESGATFLVVVGINIMKEMDKGKMKEKIQIIAKKSIESIMIFFAFFLCVTITVLGYSKKYICNTTFLFLIDTICIIAFTSVLLLEIFVFYIKRMNEKLEEILIQERYLKKIELKHYQELIEREEDTKKYRHDMNNHFVCMADFIYQEKYEEIREYLEEMQKQMREIQNKVYFVGNEVFDAILNYHLNQLKDVTSIEVRGKCNKEIEISSMDFCTIFANLVENAVEEIQRSKKENKILRIEIVQGKEFLKVEISNSLAECSKNTTGNLKTSKKDKENHGFGIENIRKVVDKNNGIFKWEKLEDKFVANVTLRIKKVEN